MAMSRRQMLAIGAAGAAGLAAAGVAGAAIRGSGSEDGTGGSAVEAVEFFGEHQAGIVTPAQDRLHFVAFDVTTSDRDNSCACSRHGRPPRPG